MGVVVGDRHRARDSTGNRVRFRGAAAIVTGLSFRGVRGAGADAFDTMRLSSKELP
jgi:hypothetical protein